MATKRAYGRIKDTKDSRDFSFRPRLTHLVEQPARSSNPETIEVYDQLQIGACTGNGWAFMYDYELQKQGMPLIYPSRMKIYYDERVEGGYPVDQDTGAEIRDGIKVIARYGVCPESTWPYVEEKFAEKPPQGCYDAGLKHLGLAYARVPQVDRALKAALAGTNPICFGFNVPESFEGDEIANTGFMKMPDPDEDDAGGHCVVATNYDMAVKTPWNTVEPMVRCRNSWGKDWGDKGYFWMPMPFFLDPARSSDFWVLTQVS